MHYLFSCVFLTHMQIQSPLLIAYEAMLLTWLGPLAVMTKSSVWPAFVQQSWKNSFHIGTICALTFDPAQRRRLESTQRFATQKHKAFQAHTCPQIRKTDNMLAQVGNAHMHTNCYFLFVSPRGQKLHMQMFCCLTGAGQTWLEELRIFATHTRTDRWSHSVKESEHEVFVATRPGKRVWDIHMRGWDLLCFVGDGSVN